MEWINPPDANDLGVLGFWPCKLDYCANYSCDCYCPPPLHIRYP